MKKQSSIFMLVMATVFVIANIKTQAQTVWAPLDSVNNVEFFYKQTTCSGDTVLFLKVVNNNVNSVTITWSLWQGGASHTFSFPAMQEVIGDCTETSPQDLWEYIPPGLTVANLIPVISTQ